MKKRKHINLLFFIEGLNVGGQQTFYYNIFKHLVKDGRLKVHIVYIKEHAPLLHMYESSGFTVNRINGDGYLFSLRRPFSIKLIKQVLSLRKYIITNKIDYCGGNGFPTFFVSSLTKLVTPFRLIRFVGGDLRNHDGKIFRLFASIFPLYRMPILFFGYSYMYRLLVESGVKRERIPKLFSGHAVDSKMFQPSAARPGFKHQVGIKENSIVVGWVGRLSPEMEIFETIDVVIELSSRNIDFHLLIVGDGPIKNIIEEKIERSGLKNKVSMVGEIPVGKVVDYYNIMDVVPLLAEDPHGGSILREAMSCGIPVITVNGKSRVQEDFIIDDVNGILINPEGRIESCADKIEGMLKDKTIKNRLGKAARKYVIKKLSFRRSAYNLYDTLKTTI